MRRAARGAEAMKNSTEIIGLGWMQRLRGLLAQNAYLLGSLCAFAIGACFATGKILGVTSAFGVALAAAAPRRYCLQSAAGAVVGYLLLAGGSGLLQAVAVAVLAAIRFFITGTSFEQSRLASPMVLATAAMAFTGLAAFSGSVKLYDGIIFLAQAALAPAAAFFLLRAEEALSGGITGIGMVEKVSLSIACAMLLIGLIPLRLGIVSVGHLAGLMAILLVGYCMGAGAGAVAGAVCGLTHGFVTGDFSSLLAAYSLSGLLTGVFAGAGRGGCAAAMLASGGFLALSGILPGTTPMLEMLVAVGLFLFIPPRLLRDASRRLCQPEAGASAMRTLLALQLRETVYTLKDISTTTRQVSKKLEDLSPASPSQVYDKVAEGLCKRCGHRLVCWGQLYDDTAAAVSSGLAACRKEGHVTQANLPVEFAQRCDKPDLFAGAIEDAFNELLLRSGMRQRVGVVRSAVTDQFEGLAMFLEGLQGSLDRISGGDDTLSSKVEELFIANKLEPARVVCHKDKDHRIMVSALLPAYKLGRAHSGALLAELCRVLGRQMELCAEKSWEDGICVIFREQTRYKASFGGYQVCCKGHTLCGDSYRQFCTENAQAHMVLSDGMGSGGSAAVDSAMAASLTQRLVEAGADYGSTLRLVNSALLVKSGEESLATIDAATANLYTGRVDFYKAGAAPTVVRRCGRVASIEAASIPAGILTGVEFEHTSLTLGENDLVVMFSDGVSAGGLEWVGNELLRFTGSDLQALCCRLAEMARQKRTDGKEDDITVVAMQLT